MTDSQNLSRSTIRAIRTSVFWAVVGPAFGLLVGSYALAEVGTTADSLSVAELTIEQKVGQMVFPRLPGTLLSDDEPRFREVMALAREGKIGGVVLFGGDPLSAKATIERLQSVAPIPLLVGLDAEWGIGMRLEGGLRFPVAMAVGAADDLEIAQEIGRWTAREAGELGIHLILAPVLDLAVEPDNRVIGIRSFGSDPQRVGRLGAAFVHGVQMEGGLAVAKHFPGHGATVEDSHFELPRLTTDLETLRRRELVPFQSSIDAGIAGVMPAHLVVAALQDDGTPASRSKAVLGGLLREELGFKGLIVSDALDMKGASGTWNGSVILDAVEAGTDILLLPPQPRVAVNALVRGVRRGEVSEQRLDASVRRILAAKRSVGLLVEPSSSPGEHALEGKINRRTPLTEDRTVGRDLADRTARGAVAWVKGLRPLEEGRAGEPGDCLGGRAGVGTEERCWNARVLVVTLHDELDTPSQLRTVVSEIARRAQSVTHQWVRPSSIGLREQAVMAALEDADALLIASSASRKSWGQLDGGNESWAVVRRWLAAAGKAAIPAVLADFDDPWVLGLEAPARLGVFDRSSAAQSAVVQALYGEIPITGTLPVEIRTDGRQSLGERPSDLLVASTWSTPRWSANPIASPAEVGMSKKLVPRLQKVLRRGVKDRVFPGAVALVARHGTVVFHQATGHLTYDSASPEVALNTVYDLASLTKVLVTTTLCMVFEERGLLDLEAPVQQYLPEFVGEGKDSVAVIDLLTHASGMLWWTDLFRRHGHRGSPSAAATQGYLDEVFGMPLNTAPRSSTEYSDLGLLLMGEILVRVSGRSIDQLARTEIFEPLGMHSTGYRPTAPPLSMPVARIAPTEFDRDWRGELVRGEVHDENAAGLGGVAPHAGVFSTAADLGRFLQMLSNGGHFDGHRLVKASTIDRYVRRANRVPGSSRAIGWDTPSGKSTAGDYFSRTAFGHTGFTGTSLWVDRERGVWAVLLTNRVHPTRERSGRSSISAVRRAFHDAIMLSIEDVVVEKRDQASDQ